MDGGRELFTCPACGKRFTYWIPKANPQPKVACYYCEKEFFPKGEPPAAAPAPAPAAAAKPEPAKPAAAPKPEPVKAG